jgi:N-terminal domain of CBF1 interacting co-repressor CIR/Pre-mRNA splicing factor
MVQGLAFLSKKSWHTKNLNNQEKVWVAEERKKAEARKTQELQKQIQQELEQQELDAIAGRTSRRDRGIDWMYEHGPTSETARLDSEKKSEEYLLGKEYVPEGAPKGDLDVDKAQEGVNKVVSSASAAAATASHAREEASGSHYAPAEPSVKERNEAFTLRFEDPMFMVAQRAVDMERKLERKKQLLERVTGAVAVDVTEGETKRKKEKKKRKDRGEKKSSKKRRRSPSVDSRSDSGWSEDRRYRRKSPPRRQDRSYSPEPRDRDRGNRPDVDGRRSHSRKRHPTGSSRYDRKRSESPTADRYGSRKMDRRSRSRSLSPSPPQERRIHHKSSPDDDAHDRAHTSGSGRFDSRRGGGSPERGRSYYSDEKYDAPDPLDKHREFRDHRLDDRKPPPSTHATRGDSYDADRRYGLQGASKLDDRRPEKLGPNEELLKKKRDEREEQKRQMEHAARRRRMTPEERAKALEEMEANARTYDSHRASKLRSGHREDDSDGAHVGRGSSATFLNEIQRSAYGVDQGISMQERLQQNRNSHQRSHDSKFL